MLRLFLPVEQKVAGMIGRDLSRFVGIVGLFTVKRDLSGDLVILEANVAPDTIGVEIGLHIFVFEVVPDIAIKFTIPRIAGISRGEFRRY